ncbi:MAG: hypothetical protein NTV51_13975 [Verrucomicrobia bacterium]|nr:hypothetical protein [Verrucomicrobiota bacterium]
MKLPHWTAIRRTLVTVTLGLATSAWAQEAITSTTTKVVAPLLRETGPKSNSTPADPKGSFFSYGNVSLHPRLAARWAYATGLPTATGADVSSTTSTYSVGLRVDAGEHWALDYTPVWTLYSAREMNDSVDHAVTLSGAGTIGEWAVQVAGNYGASSSILFETGRQTKQTNFGTQVQASRSFFNKLGFQTVESMSNRTGDGVPGARTWSTMNSLIAGFSKKFQAGVGLGAGYDALAGRPDTSSYSYMGRANWILTNKLKLTLDAGVESRHSRASAAGPDLHNPLANVALTYQPFDVTTLTLSNSETVTNSFFVNQVTEGSNWSLSWQQRLLGRLFLSTTYTHTDSKFESIGAPTLVTPPPASPLVSLPGRKDTVNGINLALTTQLFKRLDISAGYQRNANHSSQTGFTATSTQYSLGLGCRY